MHYVRCLDKLDMIDKLDMTDTLKSVPIRPICVICGPLINYHSTQTL